MSEHNLIFDQKVNKIFEQRVDGWEYFVSCLGSWTTDKYFNSKCSGKSVPRIEHKLFVCSAVLIIDDWHVICNVGYMNR